ncbi:gem-associated protein 7-like isoform X1 [Clavelina lepadiformis]|uniref:gem-associated protein 7-like isoform X1 n=1 Tax=Clavelina lepadiformis TaxID=159417 RepID=UPI00404178BA
MNEDEKKTRTNLREKFLKSLMHAVDKPVTLRLYEKTEVQGTFKACDYTPVQIHVAEMNTPSGHKKDCLLRVSDIISYSVDLDDTK